MKKLLFIFLILLTTPALANEQLLTEAIKQSDDYQKYSSVFLKHSKQLIDEGKCSLADLQEMGGWVKSMNMKQKPVYFTYCGGMRNDNKIYLNAKTGEIFK